MFFLYSTLPTTPKWCGTGKYMATYDIDGKKYGCHMATADDYYKSCVLRKFCPTCAGFNYKYRGNLADRDKHRCPMILAEAMTACEFQIEFVANMDKLDLQDVQHGQAALQVYQVLQHLDITSPVHAI